MPTTYNLNDNINYNDYINAITNGNCNINDNYNAFVIVNHINDSTNDNCNAYVNINHLNDSTNDNCNAYVNINHLNENTNDNYNAYVNVNAAPKKLSKYRLRNAIDDHSSSEVGSERRIQEQHKRERGRDNSFQV